MTEDPNKIVALGPWSTLPNDMDAEGVVGWDAMDAVARATAILAALRASMVVETSRMRWDPGRRIAYAWRPSPVDPINRKQVAMEHAPPRVRLETVLEMIVAAYGRKAADDAAQLARPRRRWWPKKKR